MFAVLPGVFMMKIHEWLEKKGYSYRKQLSYPYRKPAEQVAEYEIICGKFKPGRLKLIANLEDLDYIAIVNNHIVLVRKHAENDGNDWEGLRKARL